VENQRTRGEAGVWEYDFDIMGMYAPWVSAMAQGQAMSALLRAWQLTGDPRYRASAERALRAFEIPLDEDGVRCEGPGGGVWFAEYPKQATPRVLNGHIYALYGLWDLYRAAGSEPARELWQQGLDALRAGLDQFDAGDWSHYCVPVGRPRLRAPLRYHLVHVRQMKQLYATTGDPQFQQMAARWEGFLPAGHLGDFLGWGLWAKLAGEFGAWRSGLVLSLELLGLLAAYGLGLGLLARRLRRRAASRA
jgi:hypothetical protein